MFESLLGYIYILFRLSMQKNSEKNRKSEKIRNEMLNSSIFILGEEKRS